MTVGRPSASAEELLAHAGWLRRMARHLVRDGALAKDAAQEVWVRVQASPPTAGRSARPWLAEVLRNVVRMNARAEGRRARHEAAAAREATPWTAPAETAYERLELHRAVVEAVMALDEPLRTTVLLRYFEERSSSEIARLTGVPAGTVRWRLAGALEKIRADLDGRFGGDRRRWAVALAPLGKGALLFMAKSKIKLMAVAAIAIVLLGGGTWLARGRMAPGQAAMDSPVQGASKRWSGWGAPAAETVATGVVIGTVLAPDGRSIEGASVTLVRTAPQAGARFPDVVASARSGPGGRYRFERVEAGVFQVAAMADGFAPGRRGGLAVEEGAVVQADVRLGSGAVVLAGRVTDVGGGPVPGAVVLAVVSFAADGRSSPYLLRAVTDGTGAYRLASRAGAHRLRVEASGYASTEAYLHVLDDRTRDFRLDPAARVTGRVLARGSDLPIADAEVLLQADNDSGPRPPELDPVRTDAQGRFVFANVTPGRHLVAARKGPLASAALPVTVSATEQVDRDVIVDPAFAVSGRVLDQAGRPAAGARVVLGTRIGRESPLRTVSDETGRYRIEGVVPGLYNARAQEEATISIDGKSVAVVGADVGGIDLVIERPVRIEGEVLTAEGKPAAELEVHVGSNVHRPNRMMSTGKPVVTDEHGRFHQTIQAGKVTVSARDASLGQALEELGELAQGATRRVTLRLRAGGQARISGLVVYDDGKPGVGLRVEARAGRSRAQMRTDADGRFTLEGLDGGRAELQASAEEDARYRGPWNQVEAELTLGPTEHRQDLRLILPARGRLAGRVLAPDGSPAAGVTVTAAVEEGGRAQTGGGARRTSTDGEGRFTFDDVPMRLHTLWAIHDDYPDTEQTRVATDGVEAMLRFRPSARISGVVVDDSGRPVQDFIIRARARTTGVSERRIEIARQVRDPSGAFDLRRLGPGSYTVSVDTSAGGRAETELMLNEGESRDGVRLALRPPTVVEGRITDFDDGKPIGGAEVSCSSSLGPLATTTDADGRFRLTGVPRSGTPRLSFGASGYRSDGRAVDLPSDSSKPAVLALRLTKGAPDERHPRGVHGLRLEVKGGVVRVREARAGTPAAQAGVGAGDVLLAVGGKPLEGIGDVVAHRMVAGEPGTEVCLLVRSGDSAPREITLRLAEPGAAR